MPLTLTWLGSTSFPVEAVGLRPDDLSQVEFAKQTIPVGNASAEVGELFRVSGEGGDGRLVLEGDLSHLRGLGQALASGSITVRGPVGPRLGAEMTGGTIDVEGNVGGWAGAEMRGGVIRIRGNAGEGLGAAFPGSRVGMRDGVILVDGSSGDDAGLAMRRGLIAVSGASGKGLGRGMIAGSIFACGPVGTFPGASMKRGTIVLMEGTEASLLPTFAPVGPVRPPFLAVYLKTLHRWGFRLPETAFSVPWERYNGDLVETGQGEILVRNSRN